jgi:hypothetical protein
VAESRVYLIEWDLERFQAYVYDLPDDELSLEHHMLFDGRSVLERWEPLPIYSDQTHLDRPDIWYHTATSLPVMSHAVVDALEPFVSEAGELLPLVESGTSETVYMLNILKVTDAIEAGAYSRENRSFCPKFIDHRLPEGGFFFLPQSFSKLFCVERYGDEDTLRRRVENLGLQGMEFALVWSTSSGPTAENLIKSVPIPSKRHVPPPSPI